MIRDFDAFPVPALASLVERLGAPPMAFVYLSQTRRRIVVVATTTPTRGLHIQQEPVTSLSWSVKSETLGKAVWKALLRCRRDSGYGPRKATDAPAFRASGSKSLRAFEQEFGRVTVEGYAAVLRIEGLVPAQAANGLFVGNSITNACEFHDLGDLVRLIHRQALRMAEPE